MSIIIDKREIKLISLFDNNLVKIEMLSCGDIEIIYKNEIERLLIERKTYIDLWQSIKDGRYREQRCRLIEWKNQDKENRKILYIIEGSKKDLEEEKTGIESCRNALSRLSIFYDCGVHYTRNIESTRDHIKWISEQILNKNNIDIKKQCYLEQSIPKKKDIQSSKNLLCVCLYGIYGISKGMAEIISNEFESIYEFNKLMMEDIESMKNKLSNIKYQEKRIGEKRINQIIKMIGYEK